MSIVTLKGNPVTVYGDFIKLGSTAPAFVLVNGQLQDIDLQHFSGKRKILNIIPSLDTSVCQVSTQKLSKFVDNCDNTVLIAISADLPFAQGRFCSTEGLNNVVTLSMMRNRDFARDYGVLITDGVLKGITARALIVLSEDNTVLYAELVSEISDEPQYDKALAMLNVNQSNS